MTDRLSERRMAENQVVFRGFNRRIEERIEEVNRIAKKEGNSPLKLDAGTPLYFYCECSDENCTERIKISPKVYNEIHKNNHDFFIKPGHEVSAIETVTSRKPDYYIVRKFVEIPASPRRLQPTQVNNS